MTENSPLSEQRIIDCLKIHYGIDISTLTFLPLGADMEASLYKVNAQDLTSYFVKVRRGHNQDISAIILELLHNADIQEIIPLIPTLQGQLTQFLDGFVLSVAPFIEGQDGFHRDLTKDQWIRLGKVMRQIHDIDVPPTIQARIRRENYSPKWRQILRSLYTHIEGEPEGDAFVIKLWAFMQQHKAMIHQLVDRAEQLAQKAQEESLQFVLCHADIHGGNVFIDKAGHLYIVDWDDPIMAPRERDLMFIDGGVNNVWNKPHEEEWFYEGYGKTEINMTLLACYRYERIVEDIAVYAEALLLPALGGQNRQKLYEEFMSQFEPEGVVDIAFRTDEKLHPFLLQSCNLLP